MECKAGSFLTTYFGLPLCLGVASKRLWNPVVERVEKELALWKAGYLLLGGCITLIKFVSSNLLIYFMLVFKCPAAVANRIESLRQNFLWCGRDEGKKLPLLKWNKVCKPKREGGLGIRPLKLMNAALLGKWLWRLGEDCDGLWKQILVTKHDILRDGWDPQFPKPRHSGTWRGILTVKEILSL